MRLLQSVSNRLKKAYCEIKDYRTSRHILVFESDDWGSIRMSSQKHWSELLKMGYAVDKRPYERFDTLESSADLVALFDVLCKYKDCHGNHPVITANMLMANPDFEKIESTGFETYFYEPIKDTYQRYFGNSNVLNVMRQGIEEGVFMPQSHGREHFNVTLWMRRLQEGDEDLHNAFKFGMCGIAPLAHPEQGNKMMIALQAGNQEEQSRINRIVVDSLQMFEETWGFKSKTFVAPCYCWNEEIERVLSDNAVSLIQTSRVKKAAYNSPMRFCYSGEKSLFHQRYSVRTCAFEPATNNNGSVDALMKQCENSFKNKLIAVFSTHRINYVGGLSEQNRTRTLSVLNDFLYRVLEEYPDIEFYSSDRLTEVLL